MTDDEAYALEVIARAMCETMGDDPDDEDHGWKSYATPAYNAICALEEAGFYLVPEEVQ